MPLLAAPPGAQPTPASSLQTLTSALIRVSRAVLLHPDTLSPLGDMPIAQLRCLNAVARGEGRKMQEVAASLGIKLPAMSQIVERLVQRGMLERRSDPSDRRVTRLHLSEQAHELLRETQRMREHYLAVATAQLGPELVERLSSDLLQLADMSEAALGVAPPPPSLHVAEGVSETKAL